MYKDNLILADLYLENAQVSNLTPDQQQKLTSFIVDLVVKAERGDQEALGMLNKSPEELAASLEQQTAQVQTEAFENIRSKVGGFLSGKGSIQKRYEFLTTNLSKILWELAEDIKTTRSQEAISKYNTLQSQLTNLDPALAPNPGTLQKAAYSVGKGVGTVGKVIAGGALAKSLLAVGLPAVAVGGIMGGVLSVLKNAQNTQMTPAEKIKKALVSVGLGAMTAFAMGELKDLMGGDTSNVENAANANFQDTNAFFADKELVKSAVEDYLKNFPDTSNVQVLDNGYITYDTPNGVSYIQLSDLEMEVDQIISFNRPPGNTLAGYIADQIQ
jgi:hypothetical protein